MATPWESGEPAPTPPQRVVEAAGEDRRVVPLVDFPVAGPPVVGLPGGPQAAIVPRGEWQRGEWQPAWEVLRRE
jgi:hypothetical protein